MDSHFLLLLIFITFLKTEGVTNDGFFLASPKQRRSPSSPADNSCMVRTTTSHVTCCVCPGSCGLTYPRHATRTYSMGIKVLHLTFSIRDQDKKNFNIHLYLCARNSTSEAISQECLMKNPLRILNIVKHDKSLTLAVELPENVKCRHCLIQWVITKDMSPIVNDVTKQYFGCSDIAIMSANDPEFQSNDMLEHGSGIGDSQTSTLSTSIASTQPPFQTSHGMTTPHSTTPHSTTPPSSTPHSTTILACWAVGVYAKVPGLDLWCYTNCIRGYCPKTHCQCASQSTTSLGSSASEWLTTTVPNSVELVCRGTGSYADTYGMDQWCQTNCLVGYCPASHCKCTSNVPSEWLTTTVPTTVELVCRGSGSYADTYGMDQWCQTNCLAGYCPASHCKCTSNVPSEWLTTTVPTTAELVCRGTGSYADTYGMDQWCQTNCLKGYCPASHCKCTSNVPSKWLTTTVPTTAELVCRGTGSYADTYGMDQWCQTNCLVGYCPASHCKCTSNVPSEWLTTTVTTTVKLVCRGTGSYADTYGMDQWCQTNCLKGYCPASHCKCTSTNTRLPTTRPQPSGTTAGTANTFDTETKQIPLSTPTSRKVVSSSYTTSGKLPTTVSQSEYTTSAEAVPLNFQSSSSQKASTTIILPTTSATTVTGATPPASTVTGATPPASTVTGATPSASTVTGATPPASTVTDTTAKVTTKTYKTCKATEIFAGIVGMDNWCNINCNNGYCPKSHCKCDTLATTTVSTCKAIGPYARVPNMHRWCQINCAAGYCPSSHCRC